MQQILVGHTSWHASALKNQDASFCFVSSGSAFGLFAIADGSGFEGAKVSTLAVDIVKQSLLSEWQAGVGITSQPIETVLVEAFRRADEVLSHNEAIVDPLPLTGSGTTLTATILINGEWYIAHLGDTRVYYITEGNIEKLTHDHSLAAKLFELGHISSQELKKHPQRRVLYRGVGHSDAVDTYTKGVMNGSYLLLCTHGLWENVSDEELLEGILRGGDNVQDTCDRLVKLVIERGSQADTTVILVRTSE